MNSMGWRCSLFACRVCPGLTSFNCLMLVLGAIWLLTFILLSAQVSYDLQQDFWNQVGVKEPRSVVDDVFPTRRTILPDIVSAESEPSTATSTTELAKVNAIEEDGARGKKPSPELSTSFLSSLTPQGGYRGAVKTVGSMSTSRTGRAIQKHTPTSPQSTRQNRRRQPLLKSARPPAPVAFGTEKEPTAQSAQQSSSCENNWHAPVDVSKQWAKFKHWSHPSQVFNMGHSHLLHPTSCAETGTLEERFRSCRHQFLLVLRWGLVESKDTFANASQDLTPFQCCTNSKRTWLMTGNRKWMPEADVVEFYISNTYLATLPPRGKDDQLFLLFSMESFIWRKNKFVKLLQGMNLVRSYVLAGDLFHPYMPEPGSWKARAAFLLSGVKGGPFTFQERVPNAVATLYTHCKTYNNRSGIISSLARHVEMHNYGKCFHNRELPENEKPWNRIPYSLARYKVAIGVENALCTDYISEKSLRFIMLGVIPIVSTWRDRPNYSRRLPNNHSHIDISDFKSAREVGAHLNRVMSDEELFNSYFAYQETEQNQEPDMSEEFRKLWLTPHADTEGWCPLAEKMANPVRRSKLRNSTPSIDATCAPKGVQWNRNDPF